MREEGTIEGGVRQMGSLRRRPKAQRLSQALRVRVCGNGWYLDCVGDGERFTFTQATASQTRACMHVWR